MDSLGGILPLPIEDNALVRALTAYLRTSRAGLLYADPYEDGDALAAALDEASTLLDIPIRREWLNASRDVLAWLRADDERLRLQPDLTIVGVLL
ncbi:MAG: hypothetical protein M0R73_04515 [Dehalococcoidia bacterium]|nr:hypothetical protein [Dehalococcoidia bacterium]